MEGRITEDVTAESLDRKVEILIPEGTIAKNRVGGLLYAIYIKEETESLPPPSGAEIVSLCYDIGYDGATFDPMVVLTFKYEDFEVPEGLAEKKLFIAKYDWDIEQWQELESTVDPDSNAVTTKLTTFSTYAALAYTSPADFIIADLSLTPAEVDIGESVTISALVTNTGDLTGNCAVTLTVNYAEVFTETKEITLDGGDSQTVEFRVLPSDAGRFTVDVSGLLGEFTVRVPPPAPAPEPPPAPEPEPVPEPEPAPAPVPESGVTTWVTIPKIQPTGEGINWNLNFIIYFAIMVAVGVLVYLQKRRK